MRLIGVDPGYDRLGVAVIEKERGEEKLIYSDCLMAPKSEPFAKRLLKLGGKLEAIIKSERPERLALEELFFAKNRKTALAVAAARGMIMYLAAKHRLPLIELPPATVKTAITGYGMSDKAQVAAMLPKLIKIEKRIRYDDEADAIAVALAALAIQPA